MPPGERSGEVHVKIGVAVSGGGHRATLFGLGVLLYLADAGVNRDVVTISSVSGGSIANAYVGMAGDYREADPDEFRSQARRLATQIATRGTLFAWWGTWVYLAGLFAALVVVAAAWWLPVGWQLRLPAFVLGLMLWDLLLLRRRGVICGRAYAATVFRASPRPLLTAIARPGIDHVICATHLHAGEHFYFSGRFVNAYRFGWGDPELPLHVAVQASTALPGAFPPRWIRSAPLSLHGGSESAVPQMVGLVDGGVYDNMAEQWLTGLPSRSNVPDTVQRPDAVVIANASASMGMQPVRSMHIPLWGELAAFKRDSSIMYDNSASIRKSDLVDRFDAGAAAGALEARPGWRGALLDIRSDPFAAARRFENETATWPDRAARARAILAQQPDSWQGDGRFVSGVKTSLSRLGVETSARILRHAYALSTANLHLFLGLPLVAIPPQADFEALCSDPGT